MLASACLIEDMSREIWLFIHLYKPTPENTNLTTLCGQRKKLHSNDIKAHCTPYCMSAIILWGASSLEPGAPAEPGDSAVDNGDETASSSGEGELKQAEGLGTHGLTAGMTEDTSPARRYIWMRAEFITRMPCQWCLALDYQRMGPREGRK